MAKRFIQAAIKHPGLETSLAKAAGMTTHAYMEKHEHDPGKPGDRARFGLRLEDMHPVHRAAIDHAKRNG